MSGKLNEQLKKLTVVPSQVFSADGGAGGSGGGGGGGGGGQTNYVVNNYFINSGKQVAQAGETSINAGDVANALSRAQIIEPWQPEAMEDIDFILNGVGFVSKQGHTPCMLTVDGKTAFPILVGSSKGIRHPVVAGSYYGKGKVIVFGHTSLIDSPTVGDNNKLTVNCVTWASAAKSYIKGAIITGSFTESALRLIFTQNGMSLNTIGKEILSSADKLKQYDVLIINNLDHDIPRNILTGIQSYVSAGGALILGGTAWSFYPPDGETHITSYFGNKILQVLGGEIQFVPGYAGETTKGGYLASKSQLADTHSMLVWDEIKKALREGRKFSVERANQPTYIVRAQMKYGVKILFEDVIQPVLFNSIKA